MPSTVLLMPPPKRLADGDDCEQRQHDQFGAEQHHLGSCRELDSLPADPRHGDDEQDPDGRGEVDVVGRRLAEQQHQVLARHAGEVGHDHQVGDDAAPPGDPPGLRAEGTNAPGEVGAAVGVGLVEVVEGGGDARHRHEGEQHDERGLLVGRAGDEPDAGGQAVAGRRRGDPDDDDGYQSERTPLQALRWHGRFLDSGTHDPPRWSSPGESLTHRV